MKRKWYVGAIAAVLLALCVVGPMVEKADAAAYTYWDQWITIYCNSLCYAALWDFTANYWVIGSGGLGGYGTFDAYMYYNYWGRWYAICMADYGTGRYEDVFYSYENDL